MDSFRIFFETEEEDNVKDTISKLPKSHQKLLNGYKFKFTPGNTLKGDDQHIGYIHKDRIVVAAPWHYSRSFTTLHEIAHLVYEKLVDKALRKKWSDLMKKTKKGQIKNRPSVKSAINQNDEEIFAMSYANFYARHKVQTYDHPEWMDFIKNLP